MFQNPRNTPVKVTMDDAEISSLHVSQNIPQNSPMEVRIRESTFDFVCVLCVRHVWCPLDGCNALISQRDNYTVKSQCVQYKRTHSRGHNIIMNRPFYTN